MLQTTFNHIQFLRESTVPIIITHEEHRFAIAEQIRQLNKEAIILVERKTYNTATAVAIATLFATSRYENPLILVLPSDHYISDPYKFANMITNAESMALQKKLVVFGVHPTEAKTEYGYIKGGEKIENSKAYAVENFVEKPDLETAQNYLKSGEYYWNAGIFLYQADALIYELNKYEPRVLLCATEAIQKMQADKDFIYLGEISEENCPNLPIDKAVFEKTHQAVVFPFACDWQDLGEWNVLYQLGKKDKNLNVVQGKVVLFDTEKSYLFSNKPLLVTLGISDCLVVATDDAILVARLDKKQDIKKIVEYLNKENYSEN